MYLNSASNTYLTKFYASCRNKSLCFFYIVYTGNVSDLVLPYGSPATPI